MERMRLRRLQGAVDRVVIGGLVQHLQEPPGQAVEFAGPQ
jgi:hypothetical protein